MDSSNYKNIKLLNKAKATLFNFYSPGLKKIRKLFKFIGKTKDNGHAQTELDRKLVFSLSKSRTPNFKQLKYIKRFLTRNEFIIIIICLVIIVVNSAFLGFRFYNSHLQTIPVKGGEYIEGLVGLPKHVNPLYAVISDVDNDISNLVFSSLFKRGPNSELINDLTESYEISQDNKVYLFKIKQGVKWHNGSELTADDIIFTFNAFRDKQYQSPWRASFSGVAIEKVDQFSFKFILNEPYAAFLDLLTFGILPQEIWQNITPNSANLAGLNLKPIGSGPYIFKSLIKDEKTGNVVSYNIIRNEDYYGQAPYIDGLTFKFFPGFEEAVSSLNSGLLDGLSYLPEQMRTSLVAQSSLNFYQLNLPQLTAIFFNQQANPAIQDKKIRQALALAIDKNKIIKEALNNQAHIIDGPILPNSFAYDEEIKKYEYKPEEAKTLLDEAGWKIVEITEDDIKEAENKANNEDELADVKPENKESEVSKKTADKLAIGSGNWRAKDEEFLVIRLTTVNNEDNIRVANMISEFWQAINIKVEVEFIPAGNIQTDIIKPRNFSALLYGLVVGADPDPYAFWHSSQIGEKGLNLTNYIDKTVDALLEDSRLISDLEARKEKYKEFQKIIAEEEPVIFIYSPTYTYVQAKKVKGFNVKSILAPRDRFSNISELYIKTGKKLIWN